MQMRVSLMVAVVIALGAVVSTQQRVVERISAFDYDVVPNWSLPYPKA